MISSTILHRFSFLFSEHLTQLLDKFQQIQLKKELFHLKLTSYKLKHQIIKLLALIGKNFMIKLKTFFLNQFFNSNL